uniref:DNA-directed RNA polymerase n=1 Tax=Aphanochaete confervicola TaxID=764104 RepID=A0A6H1XE17_9CHLO|nr:alpha subunit of RNA polymerase [Aphanochaete confervicola]QJA13896.1 alpha subunit of RNA polymerase [Aphanochaete confervicola]
MSKKLSNLNNPKEMESNKLFYNYNINKSETFLSSKNPILVSCRESIMENRRSFYGRFYLGPLEVGQGITLANALRRMLLSELTGLAITSVEIEGVSHEYSSIQGVRESVLDILLNIKHIVLKSKVSLKRPQIAYIHCKGPGVLCAGDIVLPSFIQCVDPEQYIATLSYNGSIKMKLIIRQGKNYLVQKPTYNDPLSLSNSKGDKKSIYPNSSVQLNLLEIADKTTKQNTKIKNQKNKKRIKPILPLLDKYQITGFELIKLLFKKKKLSRTPFFLNFSQKNSKKLESLRSIRLIFKSSKTKQWFIYLLKKQLVSTVHKHLSLNINNNNKFISSNIEDYQSILLTVSSMTKPLAIDSVFMPVTRVNYILEENSQKLFDEFIYKDFSNNIDKSNIELNLSNVGFKQKKNGTNEIINTSDTSIVSLKSTELYSTLKENNFENYWALFNNEVLNSFSSFVPVLQSAQYFEQFNKSPKEVVILEIWTNGSILPRLALNEATRKLLSLLIKFQKAKMMESNFYKTNTNYYQIIENLYRHYDYTNYNILQHSIRNSLSI